MPDITKIQVYLATADVAYASAEGRVYLGIAGREFALRKQGSDTKHQQGEQHTYTLGKDADVAQAQYNDPAQPTLDTDDLDRYPVYIRFVPSGEQPAWCLEWVDVTVNPQAKIKHYFANPRLDGTDDKHRIWLDTEYGTVVHLKRNDQQVD
ncbi:hypothetical protein ACFUCH_12060 [Streptomyces olivaceus]|uniref:hypothetical protein n=1 Tax=Streptomyces olivaceus TaxID=47716 RepID=UPI0036356882